LQSASQFSSAARQRWATSLPDPKGQPLDAVRKIRDLIHEQVKNLLRTDCTDCCSDRIKGSTPQMIAK
jgi:hypothetical protein